LHNQLSALKSKIGFLENQITVEREAARKLREDLDEAVKTTLKALNESDALRSENKALKAEVASLRKQLQETSKVTQTQRPTTAKERVKERVEAEKRKNHTTKGGKQHERDNPDRSFIQVFTLIIELM
jgi:uncharacterized coiled-coil DUF342 family protein